jgi:hypothetical protein
MKKGIREGEREVGETKIELTNTPFGLGANAHCSI